MTKTIKWNFSYLMVIAPIVAFTIPNRKRAAIHCAIWNG